MAGAPIARYRASNLTLADGDYTELQTDNTGALRIAASISATIEGFSTEATLAALNAKLPSTAALADATTNPTISKIAAFSHGFNGTTWDRMKTGVKAVQTASTGMLNAISMATYTAAGVTPTDGQMVPLQTDSAGALLVNAGGAASAALADAKANPTVVSQGVYNSGFNGTTWDRMRTGIVAGSASATGVLNALNMGRYNASAPTLTDGDIAPAQLTVNGYLKASVITSALPTGAASETTLAALNTKVTAVDTGAVVVASSALPSGAATESTLSTLSGKLPTTAALADATTNPTLTKIGAFSHAFNGTTWDRIKSGLKTGTATATGMLNTIAGGVYNSGGVTPTSGDVTPLQQDAAGALLVNSGGASAAALADATTNPTVQSTGSYTMGFNGTTWDRMKTGLVAVQTSMVGILNTIGMGRYNATPPTLSDGNTAPFQMKSDGSLIVSVHDTALPSGAATETTLSTASSTLTGLNAKLPSTGALGDATSNPTLTDIAVFPHSYNGTTWDRIRSGIKTVQTTATGLQNSISMGTYTAAGVTPADGNVVPLQTDSAGALLVNAGGAASAALADAKTNPTVVSQGSYISGFNGTTWDRVRTGLVAVQTTFVGLLNTLPMARYNATPPAPADGNVVPLQANSAGNLMTAVITSALPSGASTESTLSTASSTLTTLSGKFASSAALADATSNPTSTIVAAANETFNGTTWDRARSGITTVQTAATGLQNGIGMTLYNTAVPAPSATNLTPLQSDARGSLLVRLVGSDASRTVLMPDAAALADALTNPTTTIAGSASHTYNGTTWDRQRSGSSAVITSFTGVPSQVPFAVYNTSAPAPSNGNGVPLQSTSAGNLKVAEQGVPTSKATSGATGVQKVQVKASAGTLYYVKVANLNAAIRYVFVFDNTTDSGTCLDIITLQAKDAVGCMVTVPYFGGLAHATGIELALSTSATTYTAASTDMQYVALYT